MIPHESEQSTLGKRRLYAHCRDHARKRRGARAATRNHKRAKGTRPRMRRWHDGIARGETRSGLLGIDIARNLVEAGNKRAAKEGLTNIEFQEGDASNLEQLPDKAFDLVISIFGAMFAPKPFEVAKEMVRVTRPGGRIVMGNWIPNDPTLVAQILKICSGYIPPPPEGFVSPITWGIESNVIERFTSAGVPAEKISFARDTFTFNFPGAPSAFVDEFRKYYGPTMNAFEAAEKNGRAADLQRELEELFASQNKSPSKDATSIPATFLRVTVAP